MAESRSHATCRNPKKAALIAGATRLLQEVLGKRPEDVTVLIDEIDPDNWGQGGESATELRQRRRAAGG
ncbi:tautomerase family protein [Variovorax sp.]|uniref:tautomerase family protein n=1 Tax=Variovorax sp. TaxID=1871043 RepID=UPI003BA9C040